MGDHWLPELVQRRFANRQERVRVRNRSLTGNTYVTNVANNFQQNRYNTLNLPGIEPGAAESALATDIEGPGDAAIRALLGVLAGGTFGQDHKAALSYLMAAQLTRPPQLRTMLDDANTRIQQLTLKMQAAAGKPVVGDDGEILATPEQAAEAAALIDAGELTITFPNEFHVLTSLQSVPELVKFFFLGTWRLLVSDNPWFVLPDAWVILERPADANPFDGIGLLTSDRYVIPLDPFTCLEIEPLHTREGRVASARIEIVHLTDHKAMRLAVLLLDEAFEQFVEHPDLPASATLERVQELRRADPAGLCYHTDRDVTAAQVALADAAAQATWCVRPTRPFTDAVSSRAGEAMATGTSNRWSSP